MAKMAICKSCRKEITSCAKCPNCCGKCRKLIMKHNVTSFILIIVALLILSISSMSCTSKTTTPTSTNSNTQQTDQATAEKEATDKAAADKAAADKAAADKAAADKAAAKPAFDKNKFSTDVADYIAAVNNLDSGMGDLVVYIEEGGIVDIGVTDLTTWSYSSEVAKKEFVTLLGQQITSIAHNDGLSPSQNVHVRLVSAATGLHLGEYTVWGNTNIEN